MPLLSLFLEAQHVHRLEVRNQCWSILINCSLTAFIIIFSCLIFIRQLHGQWVPWTKPVMPANVLPAFCILPFHWDDTLPSHCSHFSFTWVQCWHPSLGQCWCPQSWWVKSSSLLPSSFFPLWTTPNRVSFGMLQIGECQPQEVWQQKWYLTEHSAHRCCYSNVTHAWKTWEIH